jgi:hypothetical protein
VSSKFPQIELPFAASSHSASLGRWQPPACQRIGLKKLTWHPGVSSNAESGCQPRRVKMRSQCYPWHHVPNRVGPAPPVSSPLPSPRKRDDFSERRTRKRCAQVLLRSLLAERMFVLRASGSPNTRLCIRCQDSHSFVSSPLRPMSTLDRVMWFAKSRRCRMHFKNQHALMERRKGNVLEIKACTVRRRADSLRGTRQSHPPDTDSRLLTELYRSRMCSRP